MTEAESRGFLRAGLLLLMVSALRAVAAGLATPPGPPPPGPDVLPELQAATDSAVGEAAVRASPLAPGELLDPNRADEAQLDRLPGVGPSVARAWVATRDVRGSFRAPEDLLAIPGVGPRTLERLRPYLDMGALARARRSAPPPPVLDVNRADEQALEGLPGIGPALAGRIVESRRREGRFRDLDDLQRVPGIGPSTARRLEGRVRFGPG